MMRNPTEDGPRDAFSIDYDDAEHYLETLIGREWRTTPLVFQTFDDNRDRKRQSAAAAKTAQKRTYTDPFAKIHCGLWQKCRDTLTTINKNGGGVYLTVNHTEGGRTIERLKAIRAVWCEWDSAEPLPEWPIAPHLLVESSPRKYHVYWIVNGLSANDHHRIMQVMVEKWGSDPNAMDVVRVLRLPGFFHRKIEKAKGYLGQPWRVRLLAADATDVLPAYTFPQLLKSFDVESWEAAHPHEPPRERTQSENRGHAVTPIHVLEVREALSFISPHDRQVWLKIGMSLASTYHSSAFQLWDEWSKKSDKYDEDDQYRVWNSFRENRHEANDKGITLGTLYKHAKAAGWDRDAGWTKGLITTKQGDPIACPANIALILRHTPLWSAQLRFNAFSGAAELGEPTLDTFGRSCGAPTWSDAHDALLADFLRQDYRMPVFNLAHCAQAADQVARDQMHDPITGWLDAVPPWDNTNRLDHFFADYCNTPLTPYTAFCGRSLFLSLVARAYNPGCQVDTVIVLEGAEGGRKTSLCRLIGGPWYKAISMSFETKDLFVSLKKAWVAELAELDAFARSGQARIKSLLTTLVDSYRPSYGRHEIDQPRRTVFIGTTNDPVYIVDPYGARRFFPIRVVDIQLDKIAAVLPQLFAEACARYRAGEQWWTDDPTVLAEVNDIREQVREGDPWEAVLSNYVYQHEGVIFLRDIFSSHCLDVATERQTRAMQTRVGIIMKNLGYKKKRRRNELDWRILENVYEYDPQ